MVYVHSLDGPCQGAFRMVRVIADWTVRMGLLLWRYQSERWRQIQVIRCRHAETSCSLLGDLVRSTLSQLFLFPPPNPPLIVKLLCDDRKGHAGIRDNHKFMRKEPAKREPIRTDGQSLSGSEQMAVHHPVNADTGRIP